MLERIRYNNHMAEGNQEIPIPSPREQPLDTKLKKDSVDKSPFDKPKDLLRTIPSIGLPTLVWAGLITYYSNRNIPNIPLIENHGQAIDYTLLGSLSVFAARGIKDVVTEQIQIHRAHKTERTHSVAEEELGYRADRCVYQGEKPIEMGNDTFKKGDNFYFIQLPIMPHDLESSPEALNAWLDAYNYSINDIKERLKDKNYQFVAIDTDISGKSHDPFSSAAKTTRKEIFAGRQGRKIKEEQKQSLLFTRDEFEDITMSPQEIFEKLTRALGDEMFSHFVSLAKQAKTPDEKSNSKNLVKRRLNQILHLQLEMQFNSTPEIRIARDSSLVPERQRVYERSLIQETDTGLLFVTINDAQGEVHSTPLDTLLKTKDQPIDEIIASDRPIRKAQIAYILHNILRETELENLIKEPVKNKDEIISNLNKYGVQAILHESVSKLVERKALPPGTLKKLRLLLAPFILYSALQQGILMAETGSFPDINIGHWAETIGENIGILDKVPGNKNEQEKAEPRKTYPLHNQEQVVRGEVGFHDSLPRSGIDWNIETNRMSPDGYYITDTSHVFKNKRWDENDTIKRRLELPKSIELTPTDPYLQLNKYVRKDALILEDKTVKIPIRENTKVAAINILNFTTAGAQFQTEELTDGTIQVRIQPSPLDIAYIVDVTLLPTVQNNIHATERLTPIDPNKLSEATKGLFKITDKQLPAESSEMFDAIRESHEYSIDPPEREKLERAKTPEQVINAIVDIHGCSCEICNSAAVLASSLQKKNPPINMAYGYIASDNNPAGASATKGQALRSETRHAFGIGSNGEILDATPSNIASDELTKAYIDLLRNPPSQENPQPPPPDPEVASRELVSGEMKLLAALLAAGAGVFGTYQTARFLKRPEIGEKIGSFSDSIATSMYSLGDLQKAYNFFEWLSWGKAESSPRSDQKIEFSDKKEALAKIRSNINYEKLAQYLERPKAFERIALKRKGMAAMKDKFKLRSLANYLLA